MEKHLDSTDFETSLSTGIAVQLLMLIIENEFQPTYC